jgi:hypothetical protein
MVELQNTTKIKAGRPSLSFAIHFGRAIISRTDGQYGSCGMSVAELRERRRDLAQALEFALDSMNQPVFEFRDGRNVDVTQARIAELRADIKALMKRSRR